MGRVIKAACALIAAAVLAACAAAQQPEPRSVLIFSHSTGYRHASIEPGVAALTALGERAGYDMRASEDPDIFSSEGLAPFDAIILISNTTGRDEASEYFTPAHRAAFESFVHRGGGVVGIHAASNSHYNWAWYGRMIGALFVRHPPGEPEGRVSFVDREHPATRALPETVMRVDEWYYYDRTPSTRVLAVFDPQSIGESDAGPNPISWAHEFEGGRVFYTGLGHTDASYSEPLFLEHVGGGLAWVLGEEE